jgi:hypothetical protein
MLGLGFRSGMHLFLLCVLSGCSVAGGESGEQQQDLGPVGIASASSPTGHVHQPSQHDWSWLTRLLQEQPAPCDVATGVSCTPTTTNPEEICQAYNAANSSVGNCVCERFGKRETKVTCELINDCSINTTVTNCYNGTIERYLNVEQQARSIEACVRFPNAPTNPDALTCIQTYPLAPGNFSQLAKAQQCRVRYTPTGQDPKECYSCGLCDDPTRMMTAASSDGSPPPPVLSFDCCNLQTDLQQTCYGITKEGVAIPNFDPIVEAGTCTSGAAAATIMVGTTATALLAVSSLWMGVVVAATILV